MSGGAGAFAARYGPTALVAGASEGLGAAFAEELARRGLDVVLLARRADKLRALASEIAGRYAVQADFAAVDLGAGDRLERIAAVVGEREIGLVVYNAALSPKGEFLALPAAEHLAAVELNCSGPVALAHRYGEAMAARGRGGILLMSSLSGFHGSPLLSSYAATKAFNTVLAEGLSQELSARGVDVLACCAGATRTPSYLQSLPDKPPRVPEMEPAAVAAAALDALGRRAIHIPGRLNRLSSWLLRRVLSRRLAARLMARSTRALYGAKARALGDGTHRPR